ncbi:hypothetical protein Lal_00042694 [Lupinus albus]|nr:hypothetical protein Lal_00042694 [Lupinus albus]
MSFQTPENEPGTMVNTQTPIRKTPDTQTQKHKPRGVTAMKSVVRARSNNNKLMVERNAMGQPLNSKGGKTLVSYIGVVVRQNISIKFKHWSNDRLNVAKDIIWKDITATFDIDEQHRDYIMKSVGMALREFRTNCGKCLRDAEGNVNLKPRAKYANLIDEADWVEFVTYCTQDEKFLKISEQNRKRASNPIYPYRASRMGYRGLEQSEKPSPSSAAVDLDVPWVILKEKESFQTADSQVMLENALGLRQYPNRIYSAGFGASK